MSNLAVLTDIIKETKSNWRFIFESPLYDELKYAPGQLVQLLAKHQLKEFGNHNILRRNYSIASWPDGTNKFELIITYLKGGLMSEYLFNEIEIGDEIVYKGPMGIFTLPDKIDRDIYFVSTGSGISPFRSMVNWIAENNIQTKKIKLFFGTRTKKDICYYNEMLELEKKLPNFEYVPVLSRHESKLTTGSPFFHHKPLEDWDGARGYVHEHYLKRIKESKEKPLVYFCGWSKMISEGRDHLSELGFEMSKDIRVEIFG